MEANPRDYPERPLLGVSVAVWRGGEILLVKRGRPPLLGVWSFPGGLVEAGERLEDAARREVIEESGVKITALKQIDFAEIVGRDEDNRVKNHYVLIVFESEFAAGELRAGDDAAEVRWVAPKDLKHFELAADTARILSRRYDHENGLDDGGRARGGRSVGRQETQ